MSHNQNIVRLSYKPYFFCQPTVFFSHDKSENSIFSHGFSDHLLFSEKRKEKNIPFASTLSVYLIHNLKHLPGVTKEPILTVNLCQCLQQIYAIAPLLSGLVIHWIKRVPKQECPAWKFKNFVIMIHEKRGYFRIFLVFGTVALSFI